MSLAHPPRQFVVRTPREFIALRLPLRGITMAASCCSLFLSSRPSALPQAAMAWR